MTDQAYLQKINGNPGFVDGATIPPFASKAALDASGSGWEIGTIANAAGVTYSWGGAGVGWARTGDIGPGSPSTPFVTIAERTAWATANLATLRPGVSTVWGPGNVERIFVGPAATMWHTIVGSLIIDLLNPCMLEAPGNTNPADTVIFTYPLGEWEDGESVKIRAEFETGPTNTGSDSFAIIQNGVTLLSVAMPANQWSPMEIVYQRVGTLIYRRYISFTGGVSTTMQGGLAVDMSVVQPIVIRLTPANGANKIYLRRFSIVRD